jgi:hypothetical protein
MADPHSTVKKTAPLLFTSHTGEVLEVSQDMDASISSPRAKNTVSQKIEPVTENPDTPETWPLSRSVVSDVDASRKAMFTTSLDGLASLPDEPTRKEKTSPNSPIARSPLAITSLSSDEVTTKSLPIRTKLSAPSSVVASSEGSTADEVNKSTTTASAATKFASIDSPTIAKAWYVLSLNHQAYPALNLHSIVLTFLRMVYNAHGDLVDAQDQLRPPTSSELSVTQTLRIIKLAFHHDASPPFQV